MKLEEVKMIKNGKPYTNENGWEDSELIIDISTEQQEIVLNWIRNAFIPRKTKNRWHSSYGLKHYLQRETGMYLTNNQFKDAMMISGFYPVDPNELNWCYGISKKSPVFRRNRY